MIFYVYTLIDPRDGVVFYVGKGSGRRMHEHNTRSNNEALGTRIHDIIEMGLEPERQKVLWTNSEAEAYKFEFNLIRLIGLENLCNVLPGGSGRAAGTKLSEETKRKMSESSKDQIVTIEHRRKLSISKMGVLNPQFGKPIVGEHRLKLIKASQGNDYGKLNKGNTLSPETKKKMSEARYKYLRG